MNKKLILLMIVSLIAGLSYGGFFLDQGVGVKGKQVGCAYTAGPAGVAGIYWNIGELCWLEEKTELYLTSVKSMDEAQNTGILYGQKLGKGGVVGIGWYQNVVEGIEYTETLTSDINNGNFGSSVAYLGYSQVIDGQSGMGVSLKYFSQKALAEKTSYALDWGYSYRLNQNVKLGVMLEDVYSSDPEIKGKYRAGLAIEDKALRLGFDVKYHGVFEKWFFSAGLEYKALGDLILKGGYNQYDERVYLGASLEMGLVGFDYVMSDLEYGMLHQIGFRMGM